MLQDSVAAQGLGEGRGTRILGVEVKDQGDRKRASSI